MATGLLGWQLLARSGRAALPQPVSLSGESVTTTPEFALSGGRYALSAELQAQCQYTFYLTPVGQLWNRSGVPIASVSGEPDLQAQTDPVAAGRYFVHAFTVPEEGCSWAFQMKPLK